MSMISVRVLAMRLRWLGGVLRSGFSPFWGTGLHGNGEVSDVSSRPEPHSSTSVLQRQKKAAFCGDEVSGGCSAGLKRTFSSVYVCLCKVCLCERVCV